MNAVESIMYEELTHLLDRIATSVPDGALEAARARNSTLRTRLDEAETRLAAVRESMLEGYGQWQRALEDVENLWALAAWRSAAAEEAVDKAPALAA